MTRKEKEEKIAAMSKNNINTWTIFPLPTIEEWQQAGEKDTDICLVIQALENDHIVDKALLVKKEFHKEWKNGTLETEAGISYQFEEPRKAMKRQLRRRVVPMSLRRIIIAAYHASPVAGHMDFYKTYFRIAARFWWPGMSVDIKYNVNGCALCRMANSLTHEHQQLLTPLSCDGPFDVISIDKWV